MVEKIAYAIVSQMEDRKFVVQEMREYYIYALITLVERWLTIATIICISVICKNFIPTIIFLIFFLSLRKRTGGFHAKKFWQCYIGTVATYIAITYICPLLSDNVIILHSIVVCAIVLIAIIGTINHPNMAMNCYELKESKKAARYLLALESMVLYASVILKVCEICICYISMAIILCAILLCAAKIIGQEV